MKFLFKIWLRIFKHTRFYSGVYLKNTKNIHIGKYSKIHARCSLVATRGTISIGDRVHLNGGVSINAELETGHVIIEDGVEINEGSLILARDRVLIERDTLLGPGVKLISYQHEFENFEIPIKNQGFSHAPISIGPGCWIGANAIVMSGVRIGRNSVIGAGAVVTKDIPAFSVAVGVPARVVRCFKENVS